MSLSRIFRRPTGDDIQETVNHVLKRDRGKIVFRDLTRIARVRAKIYLPGPGNPVDFFCAAVIDFIPDAVEHKNIRAWLYGNPVKIDYKTRRWLTKTLSEYHVMEKLRS